MIRQRERKIQRASGATRQTALVRAIDEDWKESEHHQHGRQIHLTEEEICPKNRGQRFWREPALITEPNRTIGYTFYPNGSIETKTVTDTTVTPNATRTWAYTYNAYGNPLTITGPRTDLSQVTTLTYYPCTTGGECGQIETIKDALGHMTTFNTYNAYGQPLTLTDPNGVVSTLTYDARLRLTSVAVATGPSTAETTGYHYYPTGLLNIVNLPDGTEITYGYDGAHRLTDITDSLGNHIHYTLDALGNHTADEVYDPSNTLRRTHTRVFNALSQLYQDINAADTAAVTTTLVYDAQGNLKAADAPLARNTTNYYDALNRLNQITDPNGGQTYLGYDVNDNLATVKDPRGLTTTYTHNGFGDLTARQSPDTGKMLNTFDSAGNLKTSTDARNDEVTYTLDALNRVTQQAYSDQTIVFGYDNPAAGANGVGRLTSASDAYHGLSWTYDNLGRVKGKGQTVAGATRSVGYAYTNQDLVALVTPSGQHISYGYTNHRITSISINGTSLLSGVTYFPYGPVSGWTWGNGSATTRTYDENGDPATIVTAGTTNTYTVDAARRITGLTDSTLTSNGWTFGYDSLDRITGGSSSAKSRGYTYDANGNRLRTTGTTASTETVSTTSNQLNATAGGLVRSYAYDKAGNTLSYTGATFTFDQRGRMATASTSAGTTTYIYNALGQLIEKSGGGNGTILVYDEDGHILGEYSSTGGLIQETIWMGDTPVGTIRPNGSTGCTSTVCVFYVHSDHLGTPRKITRSTDNSLLWRYDPDTFGSSTSTPNGNPSGLGTFVYNLRFPGQYYQAETGLSYNYFRDYDPQTGRYIESDPIGLYQGSYSTYAYAAGNPVGRKDPTGLTSYVITTYDTALGISYGSHSALFIATPGNPSFLYDPAGDYQSGMRGSGGYFEGPDASLPDYVMYQQNTGSQVVVTPLDTTAAQEADIIQNAMSIGDQRGFTCANSVSTALNGTCGITPTRFPGQLNREARGSSCPAN